MMDLAQFLESDFTYAMSWTIIHSVWQGLLIAFLIQISFKSFAFKSAAHRHNIAFGALILIFGLSITNFFNYWIEANQITTIVLSEIVPSFSSTDYNNSFQNTPLTKQNLSSYGPWITTTWLIGFLLLSLRALINFSSIRNYKNNSITITNKIWSKELAALIEKFEIVKEIKLQHSAEALGVCTFGFLQPVILIPTAIVNALPPEEIKHILAHELSHIKRNDYLLNLLQISIETLMYYNPGIYIISRIIRREREIACDQKSISLTQNNIGYAKTLLKLSQYTRQEKSVTLAFSNNQNDFEDRIKAILHWKEMIYSSKNKWLMKTMTLSLMTIVLFAFQSPSIDLNAAENHNFFDNEKSIEDLIDNEKGDFKIKIQDYVTTLERIEPKNIKSSKPKKQKIIELDTSSKNDYKINIIIDSESTIYPKGQLRDVFLTKPMDTLPKRFDENEWEELFEHTAKSIEDAFENLEDSNIFHFEGEDKDRFPRNIFENEETEQAVEELFEKLSKMEFDDDRIFKLKELELEKVEDIQSRLESSMNIFSDTLSKLNQFFLDSELNSLFPEVLAQIEDHHAEDLIERELYGKDHNSWPESNFFRVHNKGIDEVFEDRLIDLGLINKNESFKIELSQDKLKVNGRKQPDSLRNEFLKLYKQNKGKALSKNSKFKYEIDID